MEVSSAVKKLRKKGTGQGNGNLRNKELLQYLKDNELLKDNNGGHNQRGE